MQEISDESKDIHFYSNNSIFFFFLIKKNSKQNFEIFTRLIFALKIHE